MYEFDGYNDFDMKWIFIQINEWEIHEYLIPNVKTLVWRQFLRTVSSVASSLLTWPSDIKKIFLSCPVFSIKYALRGRQTSVLPIVAERPWMKLWAVFIVSLFMTLLWGNNSSKSEEGRWNQCALIQSREVNKHTVIINIFNFK